MASFTSRREDFERSFSRRCWRRLFRRRSSSSLLELDSDELLLLLLLEEELLEEEEDDVELLLLLLSLSLLFERLLLLALLDFEDVRLLSSFLIDTADSFLSAATFFAGGGEGDLAQMIFSLGISNRALAR